MSDIREGTYPKCGADEVHKSPKFTGVESSYGGIIPVKSGFLVPHYAHVFYYVCAKCGYLESYVLEEKELEEISREWEQVSPTMLKRKNDE